MLPMFLPSVLITAMFFLSSFEKIYRFPISTAKFAKKFKLPLALAQFVIIACILLEFAAPLVIMVYTFSKKASLFPLFKLAVCSLISFTILATALYHNPFKGRESYYTFMSNISTMGGLLAIYRMA